MKINFYRRPSGQLIMNISLKGTRDSIYLNHFIDEKKWNAKKQLVNIKFEKEASLINPELGELETKAYDIEEKHSPQTAKELKFLMHNEVIDQSDFFSLFNEFITESESRINKKTSKVLARGTIVHYKSCIETLKRFEKTGYEISFDKINSDFYSRFRTFCLKDGLVDKRKKHLKAGIDPNTFGSKIKRLKTFLYWCQDRDIKISNKFWSFEIPQKYSDAQPLTGQEIEDLWKLKLKDEQWKLDVFLGLVSSGMRISDYNKVMTNMDKHIQETPEGRAIVFRAQKTNEICLVPFFDERCFRIEFLYKKYKGKMPVLNGQKLNKWLKDSCLNDRIKITSKTGRKTFCSIKYFEQGIGAQFIMPITGHKTETEFKKYVSASAGSIIKANKEGATYLKAV